MLFKILDRDASIKLIPLKIVFISTKESGGFCCWSLRLEG